MLLVTLLTAWMLLTPAYATFDHMGGLGGLGGLGGGKPKKGYGGGYGMPSIGGYGMPPIGGYGMPPIGGYGMPPIGGYGMPPIGGYGMPPVGGYGMPPVGGYGMPPIGGYGMPPMGGGFGHGGLQTMPIVIVPIKYGGFEGGGISGNHFGAPTPTGFHMGPSQGFGFEHTKGFGMSQGGFGNYAGFGRASQGNPPTVVVDQTRPNVVVQQAPRAVQQAPQEMTPVVSVAMPQIQQKARFHHMSPMVGSPCQTSMHHPIMYHQQPQMVHSLAASHAYIH